MKGCFPLKKFKDIDTPFYYYDTALLRETLRAIVSETARHEGFCVHYAVKANANQKLMNAICQAGLGADCVSGGEIQASVDAGFHPSKIVFAGVGKSDKEIKLGLAKEIFCFNVESVPELEVINGLAGQMGKVARVAFRINPNVGAHTHANITTGLAENKFGIAMDDMPYVIERVSSMKNVKFAGLHFHIGSQIRDDEPFVMLCKKVSEVLVLMEKAGALISIVDVGGGLGIDYDNPDGNPVPDFERYFKIFKDNLRLKPDQQLHFEPGRSIVGQCGSLISRVLYVKQGAVKQFVIVDAGMTDLIRPALYQAYHKIENLSSDEPGKTYDVVGPVCESSDVFAKSVDLNECHRGDLIAIRSAGAYGEAMASQYNCRLLPKGYIAEEMQ